MSKGLAKAYLMCIIILTIFIVLGICIGGWIEGNSIKAVLGLFMVFNSIIPCSVLLVTMEDYK